MTDTKGKVVAINGNMISVKFDGDVALNEVGYVKVAGKSLKSEVIRIRGGQAQLQVFEMTKGISTGDEVTFTKELLSVELGPGLMGQVFDGLQNPLPQLAEKAGYFLERGVYLDPVPDDTEWDFTPIAKVGDVVRRGDFIGSVPEGTFTHKIMVPFGMYGTYTVKSITYRDSGETVEFEVKKTQAMKDSTAYLITNVLEHAANYGFSGGTGSYQGTVAAKTEI